MATIKPPSRAQLRRQAMLDAATELFLTKGYGATSLSDIVEFSGGSRSTLYGLFGNKEGLLRAIVEEASGRVWTAIGGDDDTWSLEEDALIDLGIRFISAALAPDAIAVFRLLIAEGHKNPEVAAFFLERGPMRLQRQLSARFRAALAIPDDDATAERMAKAFVGGIFGDFHLRRALAADFTPSPEEVEAHVRTVTRLLLRGVAVKNENEGF